MLIVTGIPIAGFAKSAFESKSAETMADKINQNNAAIIGSENVKPTG